MHAGLTSCEPHHEKKRIFAYAKTKAQISSGQLISAVVLSTWIVQYSQNFKSLACFCDCTGRFVLDLVGNPEDSFSRVAAHVNVSSHQKTSLHCSV